MQFSATEKKKNKCFLQYVFSIEWKKEAGIKHITQKLQNSRDKAFFKSPKEKDVSHNGSEFPKLWSYDNSARN